MARFDVFRTADGLLLDCQTDLLDGIGSRLVVPLVPPARIQRRFPRLNPIFRMEEADFVMMTPLMAAVPLGMLTQKVTSLAAEQDAIMDAIDMLRSGF